MPDAQDNLVLSMWLCIRPMSHMSSNLVKLKLSLCLVIVVALTWATIAPLLDHHYSESIPWHTHTNSKDFFEHRHFYHAHQHSNNELATGEETKYSYAITNNSAVLAAFAGLLVAERTSQQILPFEVTSTINLTQIPNKLTHKYYLKPPTIPPRARI